MTLAPFAVMVLATLGAWLFRGQRPTALLVISVAALYLLQTAGLELVLPAATLLLTVGVWWIVSPSTDSADARTMFLIGLVAVVLSIINVNGSTVVRIGVLPPM